MKRALTILLIVGVALVTLAVSCSDDDCATCPPEPVPVYANGYVCLDPSTELRISIVGDGSYTPSVDSVTVGDSVLTESNGNLNLYVGLGVSEWVAWFRESFSEPADIMFASGDTAVISVYGDGHRSTARLRILDRVNDIVGNISPHFITLSPTDTMPTFFWRRVAPASFYAVVVSVGIDRQADLVERYYLALLDTFLVVPGNWQPTDFETLVVQVWPVTGPRPNSTATNWVGDLCRGQILSTAEPRYAQIFGTGGPIKSAVDESASTQAAFPGEFDPQAAWLEWASEQQQADR
jgi:hypothetical protein